MASNNDLDDFFKKKDRKSNKSKKPTTSSMLTNNEELLKQLVIVTSATIAFKENMISDDEDDDNQQQPINDNSIVRTGLTEDTHKHHKTKVPDKNKNSNDQYINISSKTDGQQQQQDQWEEFEASNYKYEEVRSKLEGSNIKEDNDDYDDENNRNNNDNIPGDREQQKDRRVWKTNSVKEEEKQVEPVVEQKIEEPKPAPTSSGAYRPPQLRSGASVTVVSSGNVNPRPAKKKEPNLASTDEFPTLGATVNKK